MKSFSKILQSYGAESIKKGAQNLISKAKPIFANTLLDLQTSLSRGGFNTERFVDNTLSSLSSNRLMERPSRANAQYGDTTRHGFETPTSNIFRTTSERMPLNLFLPDNTPNIIGDEGENIFKTTDKKMPVSLFLPGKAKKKEIPQYLKDERQFKKDVYGITKSNKGEESLKTIEKRIAKTKKKIAMKPKVPRVRRIRPNKNKEFAIEV